MTNQHVLVIGGSSGMGLALAARLLHAGHRVTIAGRSATRLATAAAHLMAPHHATATPNGAAVVSDRGAVVPDRGAVVSDRGIVVPDRGAVASDSVPAGRDHTPAVLPRAAAGPDGGAGGRLRTVQVDVGVEEQVKALAGQAYDHVVVTAADAVGAYAPLAGFTVEAATAVLATKVLGPWLVAKHLGGALPPGGSLVFTSGIAAYRPGPGASMIATANGALESLARSLALELAPARVNVVSPGWVDTPIWDTLVGDAKGERLAAMAARLPAGRVGTPDDIARAIVALLDNGFVTGTVLHVDGGHRLV